jgi:hypothetical protein
MEQKKRFSVRFPLSVLESIKQAAKEDNRSINSEIIWMVRKNLEERGKKRNATHQKDQT